MRKFVLEKNHDEVLSAETSEVTKLALDVDDVIAKIFNPVSSEILSEICMQSDTSLYGRALRVGLGAQELHSIGSTEKNKGGTMHCRVSLPKQCNHE